MKIVFIGKFFRLHDEEYIARSFEMLGHEVVRIDERNHHEFLISNIEANNPDLVLWAKLQVALPKKVVEFCKKYKTAAWIFDLYWGYPREPYLVRPCFKANYVFTTDGGHQKEFKAKGINHICVRQGIFKEECYLASGTPEDRIVFVGSENGAHPERGRQLEFLEQEYGEKFFWYGRFNTNEIRGTKLNNLYANAKIIVGDSVPSPYYWSNRVVETLGRGGFLIHKETEGLKEEYPDIVTYTDLPDLKEKIDYYLTHEDERRAIVEKNYRLVRDKYTMDKKCAELLSYI